MSTLIIKKFDSIVFGDEIMIRLLELRTEKKLSQRDVAKLFNISQGTYNNWENGKTQPSIEQLVSIADYFDVSLDYLLGRNDYEQYANANNMKSDRLRKMISLFNNLDEADQDALLRLLSGRR